MTQTHRIHTLTCQLYTAATTDVFQLRHELRQQLADELPTQLAKLFDAACDPNQIIHIPQLKIKLTLPQGSDLVPAIRDAVLQQLATLLSRSDIHENPQSTRTISLPQHLQQLFWRYLCDGQLNFQHFPGDSHAIHHLLQQQAKQLLLDDPYWINRLEPSFATRYAACCRWLQLLNDSEIRSLPFKLAQFPLVAPLSAQRLNRNQAKQQLPVLFFQLWLTHKLSTSLPAAISRPIFALLMVCSSQEWVPVNLEPTLLLPLLHQSVALPNVRQDIRHALQACLDALSENHNTAHEASQHATCTQLDSTIQSKVTQRASSRYFTAEAGLILLHAFLPRLFTACQLLDAKQQLLTLQIPRAAALLYWLAYGEQSVQEYQLSLIKLLLSLNPSQALHTDLSLLNETDREEAEAVLQAVIQYWSVLGKTSVAGLRQTFLQRRGYVSYNSQGWQLQIESASFDMLLGQLPWGFSMVKLPWMTQLILTEWPQA